MEINFKYDIGDTVYFCLDYLHVYKAKVCERLAICKEKEKEKSKVKTTILYNVLLREDGALRKMCLPEEALYNSTDGLYL